MCGCGEELTGKQRFWASDACRSWYRRNRDLTGNDRELIGFQSGSSGFFPNRKRAHQADIRRGKIDPGASGALKKVFDIHLVVDFSEKYDTRRPETELYTLVNHKMLRDYIQRLLEDYNPGWKVSVKITKKSVP